MPRGKRKPSIAADLMAASRQLAGIAERVRKAEGAQQAIDTYLSAAKRSRPAGKAAKAAPANGRRKPRPTNGRRRRRPGRPPKSVAAS